ncbi:MAG: MbnP family protein [Bacteroidota bacterium]
MYGSKYNYYYSVYSIIYHPIFCLKKILLLFAVAISLSSCYENIEGCLDVNATNFNVEADRFCEEDCCTYPNLRISVQHFFSETDTTPFFRRDSVYSLNGVDSFQITDVRYYLSNIKLRDFEGNIFGVEEELLLFFPTTRDTTTLSIEDNFVLVDRGVGATRTIGTTQTNGAFSGIQFDVGLDENARRAAPQFFGSNHPLAFDDTMMYDLVVNEYIVTQLDLVRDATLAVPDTTRFDILASEYLENITVNFDFNIEVGFNSTIALAVDYRKWMEGIDVSNDSEILIIEKLKENIPQSFSLAEVRASR